MSRAGRLLGKIPIERRPGLADSRSEPVPEVVELASNDRVGPDVASGETGVRCAMSCPSRNPGAVSTAS